MSKKRLLGGSLAIVCILASAILAANKNFVPDFTFTSTNRGTFIFWNQMRAPKKK